MCVRGSFVRENGERGTTRSSHGGIGLAYRLDGPGGRVVRSGGNGWYYEVEPGTQFVADDGAGYMKAVARLDLPDSYFETPADLGRAQYH
jgi:hypothetical protein